MRNWIEALPGVRFLRVSEREFDLDSPDASLPILPDEETPAEVHDSIAHIIHPTR